MVIHDLTPSPVAITVRGGVWDDDIFDQDWCNHAGAEIEDVGIYCIDSDSGQFIDDDSKEMTVCDKCHAIIGKEGEKNYGS